MNTMGKTLVIINLAFALLMLAFVATVAVTGTNWKKFSDDLSNELLVSRENTRQLIDTKTQLMTKLDANYERIAKLEKDFEDFKTKAKQDLEKEKKNVVDAKKLADSAGIGQLASSGQMERYIAEIGDLHKQINSQNAKLVELQTKRTQAEDDKMTALGERDREAQRSLQLLDTNRELRTLLAKQTVAQTTGNAPTVKDPNEPNPPPAAVKGVIEKIDDRDRSLVLISIGTDAGVDKNNTLEVYRLLPRPEYLGMIRIVEANHQKAIGRLMRGSRTGQSDLRPGDEVASQIR